MTALPDDAQTLTVLRSPRVRELLAAQPCAMALSCATSYIVIAIAGGMSFLSLANPGLALCLARLQLSIRQMFDNS
jgi:hypothetical protein